jgi:hypothetical protein
VGLDIGRERFEPSVSLRPYELEGEVQNLILIYMEIYVLRSLSIGLCLD